MGELIMDQVFGAILDHGDLLQDDPPFLLYVFGVESGVADHIAEQVDRHRQLLSEDLDEIATDFTAGKTVDKTADRIDFAGDRLSCAALRAFEEHVLEKM
jgi:hypothetical protein